MAGPVKATDSFAYRDDRGVMRVMKGGKVVSGDDPVAVRFPGSFRPAFEDTTAPDRTGGRMLPGRSRQARQEARVAADAADGGDGRVQHVGGGTYQLPNGERVKGRDAAEQRLAELDDGSGDGEADGD